jgi:hypothetical protein
MYRIRNTCIRRFGSIFFRREIQMRRFAAVLACAALATLLVACERYALNQQMEELCKKDGGVRVYETVTLPPSEYEALWKYAATAATPADFYGPNYRSVATKEILVGQNATAGSGIGQLSRLYWGIYRRSDNRLLGERVGYQRDGGDPFTLGFQPGSSSCPRDPIGLAQSVFIKGI